MMDVTENTPTTVRTIGVTRLGKRAQEALEDLPYADWADIQRAPKTSYGVANAAQWVATPTTKDLAVILSGVIKAREGKHMEQNFLNNVSIRYGLTRSYLSGLVEAVRHILRVGDRAEAKGATLNVVEEDSFKDLCNYGLKRLEIEHKDVPSLFHQRGEWVELREGAIVGLDRDTFGARLNLATDWRKRTGTGEDFRGISAPQDVVRQLYAHPDKPVPELKAVAHAPVFTKERELIYEAGYHRNSGIFLCPPDDLFVPKPPREISKADLASAREMLVDVLCDFELDGVSRPALEAAVLRGEGDPVWASGDGKTAVPPSFLSVVGFMLEQIVRPMIDGPVMPMLISKTASRAGGGLLASVMQTIVRGNAGVRPLSSREEERRKAIVAALRSGTSIIAWDNLPERRTIDSPSLALLFTEGKVHDRLLSTSEEVELDVSCSFLLVGIRPQFSHELLQRLTLATLEPQTDKPEQRSNWKHASLLPYVQERRGELLGALLMLAQNWISKGCPAPQHAPVIGRFESYTRVIGGILEAAGENWTSWQSNRGTLSSIAADDEGDNWSALWEAWVEERGLGAAGRMEAFDLVALAAEEEVELDVMRSKEGGPYAYNARSFGKALATMNGRVFDLESHGKVRLCRHDKRGNNGFPWFLEPLVENVVPLAPEATVVIGRSLQRHLEVGERAALPTMSNIEKLALKQRLEDRQLAA